MVSRIVIGQHLSRYLPFEIPHIPHPTSHHTTSKYISGSRQRAIRGCGAQDGTINSVHILSMSLLGRVGDTGAKG